MKKDSNDTLNESENLFKNIQIYHVIACILPLPLITQMLNASNLYYKYSHLLGHEKYIGAYFVGTALEISVFVCILAGSRSAGKWFAVISFFVGILFHDSWDGFVVDIPNLKDLVHITYHKEFYATTLLQLANSILGWFLSELYIEKRGIALNQQKLAETNRLIAEAQQNLALIKQEVAESLKIVSESEQLLFENKKRIAESEQTFELLKQNIATIQKQKGAHSRHLAQIKNEVK